MKIFLDTSVLVAAFWGDHPRHDPSLNLLAEARDHHGCCAAHSLAEIFAVMTSLPTSPPLPPAQAMLFLDEMKRHLEIISLTPREYMETIHDAAARQVTGGKIYDALLLTAAVKSRANVIYTLNLRHFHSLAPQLSSIIRSPS